jgi:hypothetical protein
VLAEAGGQGSGAGRPADHRAGLRRRETCRADPCDTAAAIAKQRIDPKIDVIGFRLTGTSIEAATKKAKAPVAAPDSTSTTFRAT